MKIIGITGKKQTGKSTIAKFLQEFFAPQVCEIHGFADGVKQDLAEMFRCSFEDIETNKNELRPILQFWGTEYWRAKDPNHWITILDNQIKLVPQDIVIIPDIRFPNEAEYVKTNGGIIIKVYRSPEDTTDKHPSETAYILGQYMIFNQGSLEKLKLETIEIGKLIKNLWQNTNQNTSVK